MLRGMWGPARFYSDEVNRIGLGKTAFSALAFSVFVGQLLRQALFGGAMVVSVEERLFLPWSEGASEIVLPRADVAEIPVLKPIAALRKVVPTVRTDRIAIKKSAPANVIKRTKRKPIKAPQLSDSDLMMQVHSYLRARFFAATSEGAGLDTTNHVEFAKGFDVDLPPPAAVAIKEFDSSEQTENSVAPVAAPALSTQPKAVNRPPDSQESEAAPKGTQPAPQLDQDRLLAAVAVGVGLEPPASGKQQDFRVLKHATGKGEVVISTVRSTRGASTYGPMPATDATKAHAAVLARANVLEEPEKSTRFVEAFRWEDQLDGVATQRVSSQQSVDQAGWILAKRDGFVSSLAWESPGMTIPLISESSLAFLGKVSGGASQAASAGMVFGQCGADEVATVSGRADPTYYFDDERSGTGGRFFFIANVEPGSHVLFVGPRDGHQNVSAGLPVFAGTASYVDGNRRTARTVRAQVVSGEAISKRAARNAKYKLVGSPDDWRETDAQGNLEIADLRFLSGMPAHVDVVTGKDGFVHRYEIPATTFSESSSTSLFYFGPAKVAEWIGQLDGGLSPDGGMVVAALPGMSRAAMESGPLFAELELFTQSQALSPELYTLSAQGRMLVDQALSPENPRFVAVQVPEGPLVAKVRSSKPETLWSAMLFSSPAVINVVTAF